MAQFSVELRKIINAGVNIFEFDYPLYDPNYKATLEQKIINHYLFREIGFETVGRFINRLKTKMNEIMPKYNIMYKSLAENVIDPLTSKTSEVTKTGTHVNDVDRQDTTVLDKDMTSTTVLDDDTTNSVTTVVDSDSSDVVANSQKFSDTPQGRTDLSNTDYLTEITEEDNSVTSTLDSTTTSNVAGTQDSTTTVNQGEDSTSTLTATEDSTLTVNEQETMRESDKSQAEMLEVFRTVYNDVDMLIISDLDVLFMQLY